jgi:hypothetical protein
MDWKKPALIRLRTFSCAFFGFMDKSSISIRDKQRAVNCSFRGLSINDAMDCYAGDFKLRDMFIVSASGPSGFQAGQWLANALFKRSLA